MWRKAATGVRAGVLLLTYLCFGKYLSIYLFGRARSSWWHAGSSLQHMGSLVAAFRLLVATCGIWFPDQGSNPSPLHWARAILVTGPPGKSQKALLARIGSTSGKESDRQCHGRHRCCLWFGKIPWRGKWQPTPVLSSGKFHGQRSLVGYSPRGHKESDTTEHTVIQP